ncbi:MAG: DUF1499 domain-containing protein [Alphaproteobacteria bacterium]|nr:DUF1499 domain-containing protein [Alphaproteobacteria bacterium]
MNQQQKTFASNSGASVYRHLGALSLIIAIIAVGAIMLMMFGARFGLWEPIKGFGLYRTYYGGIAKVTAGIALAAFVISALQRQRHGIVFSSAALVIAAGLLVPIIQAMIDLPLRAAPIHDISTDIQTPPEFIVLDDTRPGAQNSLEYSGLETAAQQAQAYPDIAPILTDLSAQDAFARALEIADDMGWTLVAQADADLRFEATARTPVFYFADDVVVVVNATPGGSRVDIRSVSRVGRSDQGVNAARIRAFAAAF